MELHSLSSLIFTQIPVPVVVGGIAGAATATAAAAVVAGLDEMFRVLVTDPTGQSVYSAIVDPCKVIAGLGVLWFFVPLINLPLERLKDEYIKIITLFMLVLMFVNGGTFGRQVGLANYYFIQGLNQAVHDRMDSTGSITKTITDLKADEETVTKLTSKMNECSVLDKLSDDRVTPNPIFIKCKADLSTMMAASTTQNPDFAAQMQTAIASDDFGTMATGIVKATVGFGGWLGKQVMSAAMAVPEAILNAWNTGIGFAAKMAFALSLMIMPIPLAFSFANTKPLEIWFSSLWAVGFFQLSLTVLTGSILIINAKLGGSIPLFSAEILIGIIAPALSGVMATGGGIGLFKLLEQIGEAAASVAGTAVKVLV